MPSTKLLIGDDALHILNEENFAESWQGLSTFTPGFTRLQEPEFVITWYSIYNNEYDPVVSILTDKTHSPAAIMCLAWEKKSHTLTHAGHKDAEYHGWLAKPEIESKFLNETIGLLMQQFNLKKWHWGWLPPGIKSNPFSDIQIPGVHIHIEQRNSLIWDLTHPKKLQRVRKNRSLKSKGNRLRRRGDLQFRVITCEQELADILDTVRYQCDFRLEALYDIRPFEDNPNKVTFEVSLLKFPGIKHASGLWLEKKLLAFHLGIADEKRVCLGLTSFDPTESKYSPGSLLLVELAAELTQQGFEIFDLTPGIDPYKERFANDQQVLYRPSFYFTSSTIIRARLKNLMFCSLKILSTVFGLKMHTIKNWRGRSWEINKKIKKHGLTKTFLPYLKGIYRKETKRVYRLNSTKTALKNDSKITVHKDHYRDLLNYKKTEPWHTRRDLLKIANNRFGQGDALLSSTTKNKLNWFCWLKSPQNTISIPGYSKEFELPESAPILTDFYCKEPNTFGRYLEQSLIRLDDPLTPIYIILDNSVQISEEQIRQWNIQLTKKLSCFQILSVFKFIREGKISR